MAMQINIPQNTEKRLRDLADQAGERPEVFALKLLDASLNTPTLEEDLAQFRKAILSSGESEDETATFFQSVVDKTREERRK